MDDSGPQVVQAPPAPSPQALAVFHFLKSQELKSRTCILQGQRKELFKVKRALRALQSPAYAAARSKNPALPEVHDQLTAAQAFSHLPRSLLALRVSKLTSEDEEHHGHSHGPTKKPGQKRVKGLWTVKVEPQQEIREDLYYAFFYETRTWLQTLTAIGVVVALLMIVMFPLWPPMLRLGVWYLSMGMLGLIGLFILMSIFRLILFVVTMVAAPPGLWLYPNLFEDVGFFDSFRPVWAWHKVKKTKKQRRAEKEAATAAAATKKANTPAPAAIVEKKPAPAQPTTPNPAAVLTSRKATVEEAEEE